MSSTLNATLMTVALCLAPSLTAQGDVKGPPSGGKGVAAGKVVVAPPEIKFQTPGPADIAAFLKRHPKLHAEVKSLADVNRDGKLDEVEKARFKAMVKQRHKQWMAKMRDARQKKRAKLHDKLVDRRRELRQRNAERAKKVHNRLDRNDDGRVGPRERQRAKKVRNRIQAGRQR